MHLPPSWHAWAGKAKHLPEALATGDFDRELDDLEAGERARSPTREECLRAIAARRELIS